MRKVIKTTYVLYPMKLYKTISFRKNNARLNVGSVCNLLQELRLILTLQSLTLKFKIRT